MDDTTAADLIKSFAMRFATGAAAADAGGSVAPAPDTALAQALHMAAELLESRARAAARRDTAVSHNAGKPWTTTEDEQLLTAFDGGATVDALMLSLGRTRAGVEARLVRHGRLDERDVRGGLGLRYSAKPRPPPG